MKQRFKGWMAVGRELEALAEAQGRSGWPLNDGQCASLRGIAARLPKNGVVIADEVGMGKTRIAVALTRSVTAAGGRVLILVPPGLGFQWRAELRDGGVAAPDLLRTLWQYLSVWAPDGSPETPWFEQDVVLLSHTFTRWKLGPGCDPWRWALLPAVYAHARRAAHPHSLLWRHQKLDDSWVQGAARSIVDAVGTLRDPGRPAGQRDHPAVSLLDELVTRIHWPAALDGASYRRHEGLRPDLERVVGLGLGVFDLVIIDEAHKSRGHDSGLARILDGVVLAGKTMRHLAMTATPVELDVGQWRHTLRRIGVNPSGLSGSDGDIFDRYAKACQQVRQSPDSRATREAFRTVAEAFHTALTRFLLRRDKREVAAVQAFAAHTGLPFHAYREEREVAVDTLHLGPAWKQAVCAAEALSMVSRGSDDSFSKRLRLTLGSGHGIATLIDQVRRDAAEGHDPLAADADDDPRETDATDASRAASPAAAKRARRAAWWREVIGGAFEGDGDPLYAHPALLAAVEAIEAVTGAGEKVLVFGRFTLPLHALERLLNARQMLRALDAGEPWAQAKVHDGEWTAVQAAHRQLGRAGAADRQALDARLRRQYRELDNRRRDFRTGLLERLDAGLPAQGRPRKVFEAFRQAVAREAGQADGVLALVAQALHELAPGERDSDAPLPVAGAFAALLDAVCEPADEEEDGDDEALTDTAAEALWETLEARLREEFNRPEGGFARLMYGGTEPQTRRFLQLAFNRAGSHPRVLIAQSRVGREGLNLHRACRTVVLLHPEWNPGVVEQQIGRVDRVDSLWERLLAERLGQGASDAPWPRILVRPVVFRGTYDERNWDVLRERWDALRAQLHGVVIPPRIGEAFGVPASLVAEINGLAPNFSPTPVAPCPFCGSRPATAFREIHDTWQMTTRREPACPACAAEPQDWMT